MRRANQLATSAHGLADPILMLTIVRTLSRMPERSSINSVFAARVRCRRLVGSTADERASNIFCSLGAVASGLVRHETLSLDERTSRLDVPAIRLTVRADMNDLLVLKTELSDMRRIVTVIVLWTTVFGGQRIASAADKTQYVYLSLSKDRISSDPKSDGEPIRATNHRTLKSKEEIEIWITDPNPLVFNYGSKTENRDTEDHKAALAFATQLAALLARFPASSGSGDTPVGLIEGLDLGAFRTDIVTIESRMRDIGKWLDESLEAATLDDGNKVRAKVDPSGLLEAVKRLRAAYPLATAIWIRCLENRPLTDGAGGTVSCDAPFDRVPYVFRRQLQQQRLVAQDDLTRAQRERAAFQAERERIIAAPATGDLVAATARVTTADSNVTTLQQRLTALNAQIVTAERAVVAAEADAIGGKTIRSFVNTVVPAREEVLKDATTLESFAKDIAGLMKPRKIGTWQYSLQIQKITVQVTAETKYEAFLSPRGKETRNSRVKDIVVEVSPHRAAYLRPGVAFVLGFIENPTFSTKKEGEVYRIVQDSTEITRYDVAAMLNIVPRGWDEPTFGGFFQVGVSPKKDATGFFFGAGISTESLFTFGFGAMMQQVRRLGPGLSLETPIGKPEDLKTVTRFKPGLYVHATVALPGK